MSTNNKKITVRQAVFLFITITYTPSVRLISVYAAQRAKQAGWLAPIIAVIILIIASFIWHAIYKKYNNYSLMDIYSDIAGKFIGKILIIIHLIWIVLLNAMYVRYFAVRMVGSIYPNISINVFLISILVVIAYTLRFGLTVLARLNEVIFPLLSGAFCVLIILMLPNVKLKFLTPVSYRSIFPVLSASVGATGILAYFSTIFIVGDKIINKEKIKKAGIYSSLFLFFAFTSIIVISLGIFSHSIVQRTQLPFLIAVKQISLFNTIEKIDSVVIAFWVLSDFVLISLFSFFTLHILKNLFKLSDTKPLISIYLIFIFILSLFIASSAFEMQKLSDIFFLPLNIALGFVLPIIMFIVGKIRRKI